MRILRADGGGNAERAVKLRGFTKVSKSVSKKRRFHFASSNPGRTEKAQMCILGMGRISKLSPPSHAYAVSRRHGSRLSRKMRRLGLIGCSSPKWHSVRWLNFNDTGRHSCHCPLEHVQIATTMLAAGFAPFSWTLQW
jgi:hypothetical protein